MLKERESDADDIGKQENKLLKLNDIRGNLLERSNKYFNHILKINLESESKSWEHLKMFCVLRNVLAHANGRFENFGSKNDRNTIKQWSESGIGIKQSNGVLIFSPEFVKKTFKVVFKVLKDLADQVATKYPEPINW